LHQLVAQLDEIIDLAGVDERGDRLSALLGRIGCTPPARSMNRKPAMPEADMAIDHVPPAFRTAPRHRLRHRFDDGPAASRDRDRS